MKSFNIDNWLKYKKMSLTIKSEKTKSKLSLIKSSIYAILFGFTLGVILIFSFGYNGFDFIQNLFIGAFDFKKSASGQSKFDVTMIYFSVYILFALGLSIGFKVGIFNMGGSGQAIFGTLCTILTLKNYASSNKISFVDVPGGYAFLIILIYLLAGVCFSVLAGILKVFLNIHEVVTTIMLNWTFFYLSKYALIKYNLITSSQTSTSFDKITWFWIGNNPYILSLIVALSSIVFVWVLMTFTVFGYKSKVVGQQKTAANYAGINYNLYMILSTALQGVFMSLGALFYYFQKARSISFTSDAVPSIGFDAIAVSLVAFNNFFGIIPISLLWAILQGSSSWINITFPGLSREVPSLFSGLVIYGSAIYSLFITINISKWIKQKIYCTRDIILIKNINDKKEQIKQHKIELKLINKNEKIKDLIEEKNILINKLNKTNNLTTKAKLKNQIKLLNNNIKFETKSIHDIHKGSIKLIKYEIHTMKSNSYNNHYSVGYKGIKNNYTNIYNAELYSVIDELTYVIIKRDAKIKLWKNELKNELLVHKNNKDKQNHLKKEYSKKVRDLKASIKQSGLNSINELHNKKKKLNLELKSNTRDAKKYINELNLEYKNKIKLQKNKQEILNLKIEHKEKIMEVNQIYGQFTI